MAKAKTQQNSGQPPNVTGIKKKKKFAPSKQVLKDLGVLAENKNGAKKNKKPKGLPNKKGVESEQEILLPPVRRSDEPAPSKKGIWKNKQRVLVFGARGISFRGRHIMDNLRRLLPHTKKEAKMDRKDSLSSINEICEMKNCNKCLFFEGRRQGDIYLWMSNIPVGPSVKFLLENVHTMEELKFTGNCLKGSRAILSFDQTFDSEPHYEVMKELFTQIFSTPYHHPKSQPFIDHVFTFTILDGRVWFRNYQIMEEDGSLVEIGPRFVFNPIKIFESSFGGATIWSNPNYVSPSKVRAAFKKSQAGKYANRVFAKQEREASKPKASYKLDASDEIFRLNPGEAEESD